MKSAVHLDQAAPEADTPPGLQVVPANGSATQRAATEIRGLMAARKLNTLDLAQLLKVSRDTAARRLNGDVDISINELETIADWLGVTPERIIAPAAGATYSR